MIYKKVYFYHPQGVDNLYLTVIIAVKPDKDAVE